MHVRRFNIQSGVYWFTASDMATGLHAHPATELVMASSGTFSVRSKGRVFTGKTAAIIKPNEVHAIDAKGATCDIMLFENSSAFRDISSLTGVNTSTGSIIFPDGEINIQVIADATATDTRLNSPDPRIDLCLQLMNTQVPGNNLTLPSLADSVNLSPSRLSHLFKARVGISVEKYMTWARLKLAVHLALKNGAQLGDAALTAGFYDAPHFTRRFRAFMGLKPSLVYNSQMVQDF